ncbi:helix-turn-helix domain-containing protein [Paracoccus sp. (in: a-proteobacteria)]|uniref:helix-turn-helix domain-containing protein n=1 Tax=Paracoccus sp. TaxID=267 RepID=UPI003A8863B8
MDGIAEDQTAPEGVGSRLRALRKARKVPMRKIADGTGLSISFISQIERGVSAPSLTSLRAIAQVLGVGMPDLLPETLPVAQATRSLDRPLHRLRLAPGAAHSYERITTTFPGSRLTGVIIHEPAGARIEPQSHDGEEIIFVLEGSLTVELDTETITLSQGDTLHFSSARRHATWNHTSQPAVILHICTLDVFGDQISDLPGVYAGHRNSFEESR